VVPGFVSAAVESAAGGASSCFNGRVRLGDDMVERWGELLELLLATAAMLVT